MQKQPAFPGLRDAMKKKQTRRELFPEEMGSVVPWCRLLALIAPHYPKVRPKDGRPPMALETMPRVYFLQNWYALTDPLTEETLYYSEAMRRYAGIELGDDHIPILGDALHQLPGNGRDHHPQLPPSAGAARADVSDLRGGECASGRQGHHAALGHTGRCHNHRRAVLDEEQRGRPRPRDVIHQEGQ